MNAENFLQSAIQQFKAYKQLGDKTFAQLDDKDFYYAPDAYNNSIAVNITHLHGNMLSRWTNFLTEDGEKEWRRRDDEFEPHPLLRSELLQLWDDGWNVLFNTLHSLSPVNLAQTVYIRTKPVTVIEAIHRQLTHYASHVGQIIFLGKHIKGAAWKTLSISKGGSKQFNDSMNQRNDAK